MLRFHRQPRRDTLRTITSTVNHLRRIEKDVLARSRRRIERGDQLQSDSIGRELESTQRLLDT